MKRKMEKRISLSSSPSQQYEEFEQWQTECERERERNWKFELERNFEGRKSSSSSSFSSSSDFHLIEMRFHSLGQVTASWPTLLAFPKYQDENLRNMSGGIGEMFA